ncbi:hypothetical protein LguiA_009739 [Lonicera macranthoides]
MSTSPYLKFCLIVSAIYRKLTPNFFLGIGSDPQLCPMIQFSYSLSINTHKDSPLFTTSIYLSISYQLLHPIIDMSEAKIIQKQNPSLKPQRYFVAAQLCLRFLAAGTTLAAVCTLFTSNQSALVYGIKLEAQYTYSSTFK